MAAPRPLLDDEGQPSSGSPVQIGQIVNGKYRIERQIGRGGMGIVLAATHLQLEHLVAIKVMRRDLVIDDNALDRLLMEARSAARIRSEHVARVLDVGTLENGSLFIVMEYLEGENLADLLDREGALDVEQAASFLLQCCLALAEVHVAEMVHRDLKPGNLFIARFPDGAPTVKIVDFGISKPIGTAREQAAATSPQVLGSPYYMSPEQMRAEAVDERSDIWSLGAILFEMLTGRPPFLGDTLPEVYSAVLNDAPPVVDSLRTGVPGGLDDVVHRCLEKDPAQRFCDVADLAEALAPYAGSSAPLVERVTRILTNPDVVRARYSLPPAPNSANGAGGVVAAAAASEGGLALAAGQQGEGWAPDARGGEEGRAQPPTGVQDGHRAAPGTLLESDGALEPRAWRPSRPAASGELAPFAATGVHVGRARRFTRAKRGSVLAGGAALLAVGGLWLRGAPTPSGEPVVPAVEVVKLAPVAPSVPTPPPGKIEPGRPEPPSPEPRVMPIVNEASGPTGAETERVAPSGPSLSRPSPSRSSPSRPSPSRSSPTRAAPARAAAAPARAVRRRASRASEVAPRRATARGHGHPSHEASPPEPPSLPPAPRAASRARPAVAQGDDPWNPDSFGERR